MTRKKMDVCCAVHFFLWVFLCIILFSNIRHGALYPQWSSIFRIRRIFLLIVPIAALTAESFLMRFFQKRWMIIVFSILFVLLLAAWSLICSFIFFPIVSETKSIQNYLVLDSSINQTGDLHKVFPDSEKITGNHAKYQYFNDPSFFLNGEYGFVALSLQFASDNDFLAEKNRIQQLSGITQVAKTWDGYAGHLWDGYTAYASDDSQQGKANSFSWVLVSNSNHNIVYYHRFYGHSEDDYLKSFIKKNAVY